jgi:hypothetical protein
VFKRSRLRTQSPSVSTITTNRLQMAEQCRYKVPKVCSFSCLRRCTSCLRFEDKWRTASTAEAISAKLGTNQTLFTASRIISLSRLSISLPLSVRPTSRVRTAVQTKHHRPVPSSTQRMPVCKDLTRAQKSALRSDQFTPRERRTW